MGLPSAAGIVLGCSVIGCAPASAPPRTPQATVHDHDHHDHHDDHAHHGHGHDEGRERPETLAGALAELEKVCADVKAALAKKDLDEADGHVHMVGHLLDDMHSLVGSSGLADEAASAAKKALDQVFDCFDSMDTALHSSNEDVRKAIDYLEHEPKIEAAIGELKKTVEAATKSAGGAEPKG